MTDSEKLDLILSEMQGMKQDIVEMKQELAEVKQDVEGVKQELAEVKQKVEKTELILENEIRVNIQRVAEGHLDLSRNMHEVMRPNNEIEMLAIKVRMLETDMRELKAKIS